MVHMAAWVSDLRGGLKEFYLFTKLDPGSAFVILAVGMVVGRKVYRHFSKRTAYDIRDFWKYPGEWIELGAIALLLIVGLFIKAAC